MVANCGPDACGRTGDVECAAVHDFEVDDEEFARVFETDYVFRHLPLLCYLWVITIILMETPFLIRTFATHIEYSGGLRNDSVKLPNLAVFEGDFP